MSDITIPAPTGSADPAELQHSSYAGVTTADLFVLYRAVLHLPGDKVSLMASGAVLGRIRAEMDRRPYAERQAVIEALKIADVSDRDELSKLGQ